MKMCKHATHKKKEYGYNGSDDYDDDDDAASLFFPALLLPSFPHLDRDGGAFPARSRSHRCVCCKNAFIE